MSHLPLARPVARLPGELQAAFVERVGISHDILVANGIGGIEYLRQLGSTVRTDTERSVYGGSGYRDGSSDPKDLIAVVKRRIVEEKRIFAASNNVDASSVYAKVGVCGELTNQEGGRRVCYRYHDQTQYPAGQYNWLAGGMTPNVFAMNDGQVLVHGRQAGEIGISLGALKHYVRLS